MWKKTKQRLIAGLFALGMYLGVSPEAMVHAYSTWDSQALANTLIWWGVDGAETFVAGAGGDVMFLMLGISILAIILGAVLWVIFVRRG